MSRACLPVFMWTNIWSITYQCSNISDDIVCSSSNGQLCVEHGIRNDGILEDFATQVRILNITTPKKSEISNRVLVVWTDAVLEVSSKLTAFAR